MQKAENRPDYERPEFKAGKPGRSMCYDLMEGSAAIHAGGKKYLPQWPAEKEKFYKVRASIAQVARYYQRTVQSAVGMICATPPELKDADPMIESDWEDIDGKGTHGEVFAKEAAEEMINGGLVAILVDAPPVPDGMSLTLADEQALGLRPFWVQVPCDRIVSWVIEVPEWLVLMKQFGDGTLTADQVKSYAKQVIVRQVVIYEPTDVPTGDYGITTVDRYRRLRLTDTGVTWEVLEKQTGESGTDVKFVAVANGQMLMAGRKPFHEIPLAVGYGGKKKAPFVATPPFLGLAELNIDHYQVTADRRYLIKLCHAPTHYRFGFTNEVDETGSAVKVEIGPNSVCESSNENAKAGYFSADPSALNSSKEEKEELVRQMATLGMSFLGKDRSMQSETATARALDDAAENATHATVARGLQDLLEQTLKFHAQYRGVDAPSIKVNTSYASPSVDPQIVATLWQAVVAGDLDMESFIHFVQSGTLPDDIEARLQVQKITKALNAELDTPPSDTAPNKVPDKKAA